MARPRLLLLDEPSLGLAPVIVQPVFRDHRRYPPARHDGAAGRAERAYGAEGRQLGLCARNRPARARRRSGDAVERRAHPRRLSRRRRSKARHDGSYLRERTSAISAPRFSSASAARRRRRGASRPRWSAPTWPATTATACIRVPRYVDWVMSGDLTPEPDDRACSSTRPCSRVVDGRYGFGHTVAPQAVDIGIAKAKHGGLAGGRAAQFRPSRPRRRMGGARGRGGPDLDPFRQRVGLGAGRAVRRDGAAAFDGAVLRRRSARGRAAGRARFRDLARRRRQGLGRQPRRQAAAADALIGPDGALSGDPALLYGPLTPDSAARPCRGRRARSARSASTRAPASR